MAASIFAGVKSANEAFSRSSASTPFNAFSAVKEGWIGRASHSVVLGSVLVFIVSPSLAMVLDAGVVGGVCAQAVPAIMARAIVFQRCFMCHSCASVD